MPGVHAVITARDMPRRSAGDRHAVAAAARVQAVRADRDRRRQGALRRRADRGRAGRQRRHRRGRDRARSRSISSRCRRWRIAKRPATDEVLLFEAHGTNRSMAFRPRCGDADAAFRAAPYVRREKLPHPAPLRPHHGAARRAGRVGCGGGAAHRLGRRQGAVLQPAHSRKADRPARRRHRHGGERRRRRLRRARRSSIRRIS